MLFSSLEFLYLFLPLTLLLYFASPPRLRNGVLLAVSLLFYAYGEPIYVLLMLATVAVDYAVGLAIVRFPQRARLWLWAAVVFNVTLLAFFKYYVPTARALNLSVPAVTMPIGISFYTFQALSYVVDVYRRTVAVQKSPVAFGTYVFLFPQLIAGPIVRYADVAASLRSRKTTVSDAAEGLCRFAVGLAKKVLVANPMGALWESLRMANGESPTVLGAWLCLSCFALQIYFDFSGYSDMAIGLGRLFGFSFPENFRYPYVAESITDFWRRWHITLSSWFREYVYIPLGGNRRGRARMYRNLLVTWGLTGLWHGASWSFLAWGLYFFCVLALEKAFLLRLLGRAPRVLRHFYAILLILLGWWIFAFDGSSASLSAASAFSFLGNLFSVGTGGVWNGHVRYELTRALPLLLVALIGCTPLLARLADAVRRRTPVAFLLLRAAFVGGTLAVCTAYLVGSAYNPFLYFRF